MEEQLNKLNTADLCDAFGDELEYAQVQVWRRFGTRKICRGRIETVRCLDDNSKVKQVLSTPGNGRVLVVDGGGSMNRALVGDQVAKLAMSNNWVGIIVNGCIRDSEEIDSMNICIWAIGTIPRKTEKLDSGTIGCSVQFAGVTFHSNSFVVADSDGIIIANVFSKL